MRNRTQFRRGVRKRRTGRAFLASVAALGLLALPAFADPPAPPPIPAVWDLNATPATLTPFTGDAAVEDRLDTASRVMIRGERLHEHLVRRFYAAHGWHLVWDSHPQAVAALWSEILRADRHGLDPALFHTMALSESTAGSLSPLDRDLLFSDAVLSYADALARGAVPVGDRREDEDLRPGPVDIVAAVGAALDAANPAQTIEALAPRSPEYLALRRAYEEYVTLAAAAARSPSAAARPATARLSTAEALRRARQVAINLERLRWLPRDLPPDRLVVDAAVSQLQLFHGGRPEFTTRVVVGEFDKQTPELQSVIRTILFNPPWNIPPSIVKKEIMPKLAANHGYLAAHHMRWRGPMSIQQEAGPHSALGRLKFEMEDRFDVYLHDTPEKWRFASADRMMSHGCVRVEHPRALASLLLGTGSEQIDRAINLDRTHRQVLPKPVPVFIVYRTAVPESDGSIAFRGDPYNRDPAIWAALSRARELSVAQKSGGNSANKMTVGPARTTLAQKAPTIGD